MALSLNRTQNSTPMAQTVSLPTAVKQNITITKDTQGVFDATQGGKEVNVFIIPETIDATATSNSATGSGTVAVYLFNQDYLNNTTDNGSGANSVTYVYGDGTTGKVYNQLMGSAGAGQGVKVYGFNVSLTDAQGNAAPAAFTTMALTLVVADGSGNFVPVPIKIQMAKRNTAYDQGLFTIKWVGTLSRFSQIKFNLPKGIEAAFSFFTNPDFE